MTQKENNSKKLSFIDLYSEISKKMFEYGKGDLYGIDYFVKSVCDTACNNVAAFERLIEDGNYLCASAFIRMQIDNALVAWAGLICANRNEFLLRLIKGEKGAKGNYKELKFSWECLNAFGITKELLTQHEIKYCEKKLRTHFLYSTLNLLFSGTSSLYEKGCKYIHLSEAAFAASWKGDKPDLFKVKNWKDVRPFNYPDLEIVNDYLHSCAILESVLRIWLNLKLQEVRTVESLDFNSAIVTKEPVEMIEALKNNGKNN